MEKYKFGRISSEFKDCALPYTADQFTNCSFGCQYCFSAQFRVCNPASQKSPSLKSANSKYVIKMLNGEYPDNPYYQNFIKNRFVLHWGGLTEPFCHFEKKNKVGFPILKELAKLKYPTLFSSKGFSLFLDIPEYREIFENNKEYKNFAFQFSIVTNSDITSKIIEPNTPTTSEKLSAMKLLSSMGYLCILRLRPFIIGITDIELEELLIRAKEAGAYGISTEFFALDSKIISKLDKRISTIDKLTGINTVDFYKKLSPSERGGYLRLNRDVKEEFVKRLYITCRKIGLSISISDPDFKELNDTGCCCGLPEVYPDNPELTNWNKGQITFHLKEARKKYWASNGKDKYIYFNDIKNTVFNNWMDNYRYYSDSIKYWQIDYRLLNTGHIREFIESWNNLRSPDNPYRHYHGKLKPAGIDKDNMIIYEYIPSPYEYRWRKEGIL